LYMTDPHLNWPANREQSPGILERACKSRTHLAGNARCCDVEDWPDAGELDFSKRPAEWL
jgi:hypothetical protein